MLLLTFSSIAVPASGVEGSLESSASAAPVSVGDPGVVLDPEPEAEPELASELEPERVPDPELPAASLTSTETQGDAEEEPLPPASAELLATVDPASEVEAEMEVMAMPDNPGVYFTGGSVPLQIVLIGQSTNVHTRPAVMWTDGANVCVAVKSTHRMDSMTLQAQRVPPATMLPPASATEFHAYPQPEYPQYQSISVDGAVYHPTGGLSGNTADSHWTVFLFPIASIDFGADLAYDYTLFSTYVGQGHWISGSFTVTAPRTSVTITKTWVDGPMTDPVDIDLERRIPPNGVWEYVDTFTFTPPSSTVVIDDLLMTDSLGRPYDFQLVESNPGDGYKLGFEFERDAATGAFTVAATNTYTPPIVPITATKVWEGGPAAKPTVTLQLFQDGVAWGDPVELVHPDLTYTWNAPKTKLDGTPYTYTVQEVSDPANPIPYTSAASGLTVTNTYVPPLRSFTGYKAWVGGEALGDRPTILLQLYRGAMPEGDPVPFPHGKLSHTWTNLPATDFDGSPYDYHVSEVAVPVGYSESISEDGATVTNTYTPGSTNITARKIWTGGPLSKPDVRFQLWRTHEVEGTVKAPGQDPVTLKHPTVTYTWSDLPSHATDGRPYTYTVEELEVPENYVATYTTDRLTVENRYVSPRLDIDVVKAWDGGDPDSRPTVDFQLFRNGASQGAVKGLIPGGAPVTWNVPANDASGVPYTYDVREIVPPNWDYRLKSKTSATGDKTLTFTFVNEEAPRGKLILAKQVFAYDGTPRTVSRSFQATVTGPGFPEGGRRVVLNPTRPVVIEGLEYGTYRIVEDPQTNYAITYPAQEVTLDFFDRDGELTVVNTELPRGVLNIVKIHQGADKDYALDPTQEFDIRITGPAGYSLETTITSGQPRVVRDLVYGTYTIEEIDAEGYVVEYAGTPVTVSVDYQRATILITNTYIVPVIDITATKVWSGGDAANRPVISFQLYQQLEGSEIDPVAYGDPVPITAPATTAFWGDVPKTDANRNPYVYTVREVATPSGYTVSGEGTAGNGYTITNTYVIPKIDVKATKVWQGGAAPRPTVQFQLYRDGVAVPEANGGLVSLPSGTITHTWRDLDATDVNANEYVYTVEEIAPDSWNYRLVSETGDAASGFTFTNRYVSPLRDYTVFKEWVGGDAENRPIVTIQLYRNGDEYLDPITLPTGDATDPWRYTWTDLDLTDFDGVPYTYFSRETTTTDPRYQASHADAEDDQSTKVTNSFEPELMDVTATKIWIGGASPKPPVMLELYRAREGSTAEPELVRGPSELASGQTTYVWEDLECT